METWTKTTSRAVPVSSMWELRNCEAVRRRAIAAALVLTTAACGQDRDRDAEFPEVFGVAGPRRGNAELVRVERLPEMVEIREPERFYPGLDSAPLFRVTDLLARPDGGVYIADAGNHRVVALNPDGSLEWRVGQEGEGPGEFEGLERLQDWKADTIVALDEARNTASFWTTDGRLVRTVTAHVPPPEGKSDYLLVRPGALRGVLPDGRLFVHGPTAAKRVGESGLRRMKTAITLFAESGTVTRPFSLPGPLLYELSDPGRLPAVLAPMSAGTPVSVAGFALNQDFVWARPDSFEIVLMDASGRAERIVRVRRSRTPVTSRIRSDYLEDWSPWFPVDEDIPFPSRVPAFDRVFVTSEGSVWSRRFDRHENGEEWIRYDAASDSLDRFHFPPRISVMTASSRFAYGVRRTEMGVEHVVRFRLPSE